jgi:hypothetical protein
MSTPLEDSSSVGPQSLGEPVAVQKAAVFDPHDRVLAFDEVAVDVIVHR